jgi:hypothetical protein
MDKLKRPSKFIAILFTVSAVCSLISLALMVVGRGTETGQILFQILTVTLLIIAAAGNWCQYVQRYIKYEVLRRLDKEKEE